jgi:hypothetical protein
MGHWVVQSNPEEVFPNKRLQPYDIPKKAVHEVLFQVLQILE